MPVICKKDGFCVYRGEKLSLGASSLAGYVCLTEGKLGVSVCPHAKRSMKLITVYISEPDLEAIDLLVKEGMYPNRAECIRLAVKDLLNREKFRKTKQPIIREG